MNSQSVWIPSAIPFFLFGLIYYLISPVFALPLMASENELLFLATSYMDDSYFDASYALDVLFIFLSFYIGYSVAKSVTGGTTSALDYGSVRTKAPLFFAIFFLLLIIYFFLVAVQSGAGFFTGYSGYDVFILGAFSTIVFLGAWFVNFFSGRFVRSVFLVCFVFSSALLLGWGSRMYFVLGFITLLLGMLSIHRRILKNVSFYLAAFVFGVFIIFIGVLRQGGTDFNSDVLLGIFFAEPLFSAISGSLFLEYSGGRPAYSIPHGLYAAVIHFVPSFLFPGKRELIDELTFNENIISPFGGNSLLVVLYSNFGMLYPVFIAAVGSHYGFLFAKSEYSIFYRSIYFSALPVLLFLFFRDDMATVLKVLLFNGLIVPYFVAKILIRRSDPSTPEELR